MNKNSKIYVAGHRGLVGSVIVRKLKTDGFDNLILKTHKELYLLDQVAVADFFKIKARICYLGSSKSWWDSSNNTYRQISFMKSYKFKIM